MRLPRAVRIGHAHEEDAPVAVDVLAVEAVLGLLARIRPDARAAEAAVGEPGLGAVRVHARDDVERARVDGVSNARVVRVEEVVEEVERRCRPGELHRVDLRVDEHGGLLVGRPGLRVRDGAEPDVAALVRLCRSPRRRRATGTRLPTPRASRSARRRCRSGRSGRASRASLVHRAQRARRIRRQTSGVIGVTPSQAPKASTSAKPASRSISIHSFAEYTWRTYGRSIRSPVGRDDHAVRVDRSRPTSRACAPRGRASRPGGGPRCARDRWRSARSASRCAVSTISARPGRSTRRSSRRTPTSSSRSR